MYPEMPVTRSAGKESGTSPRHPRARILGTPLSKALAVLEGILRKVTVCKLGLGPFSSEKGRVLVGVGSGSWLCIPKKLMFGRESKFSVALAAELGPMNNLYQGTDFSSTSEEFCRGGRQHGLRERVAVGEV